MEPETRTLSEILIEALRVKSVSIEKLAQLTGISERFLSDIVEGNIEKLPAAPYIHGYLIKIADVLNLNGEELWTVYLKNNEQVSRSGKKDTLPENRFIPKRVSIKTIGFIGIGIVILLYILIRLPSFFGASSLSIQNIPPGLEVTSQEFRILGSIDAGDRLMINDSPIYQKENGEFEFTVTLHPGFNTIEFKAKRFLSQEQIIIKQIFYKVATSTQ